MSLTRWRAMIIGPQNTNLGQNIYTVEVVTGPDYPFEPPTVRFQTKINMPFVDSRTGRVDDSIDVLRNWDKTKRIQHVLCSIRDAMTPNHRLPQPNGEFFAD
eukprot:TRINITY_DN5875_c0_g2_i2.p1 TRINITY_DN5875_c0_g2~~TRINITY_DN5875_c0_g2_i2.p1  ORF type:complete len:102 (-),score=26.49 TRINITY_DN5875_c0_g2_i2:71-376(-)